MSQNPIIKAAAAGVPSFGLWQTLASSFSAEVLGAQGFDWILIDTQHGGVTWESLGGVIQGVEAGGTRAMVRVGWNDPRLIMRALDLGAIGVVVPMVSTPQEALRAAEAFRYPPAGNRSFGPIRKFYSIEAANSDVVCMVMIETAEGLRNLEEIAATPGVDGLFVGPVDLSLSLGLPLSMTMHDDVLAAIGKVAEMCKKYGKIAGAVSLGPANPEQLLALGVGFITLGADVTYLTQAARQDAAIAASLKARFASTSLEMKE
jgi:4-hydroxy-2-oxoheptanedioate aldolase